MYKVIEADGDTFREKEEAALIALNERLRDDYVADCARGVMRWNQIIKRHGIDFELKLPHRAFHRQIGQFAEMRVNRSEEHTSELQSLMRISYAVFCLKKNKSRNNTKRSTKADHRY